MADSRRAPGGTAPSGRPGGGSSKRGPSSRSSRVTTRQVRATVERQSSGSSGGSPRSGGNRPRYSLTSRAALLALVVAVLLVSYAYPLRSWLDQQNERQSLQAEAEQLRKENARLEGELRFWNDPAYVEAQARERLGFVMPGEEGYIVVPEDTAESSESELPEGVPPASSGTWYERLWGSVKAADAVRPPADE